MQLYVPVSTILKSGCPSTSFCLTIKNTLLIECNSHGLNQNNLIVIGYTLTQPCVKKLGCVLDVGLVMSGHAARMCMSLSSCGWSNNVERTANRRTEMMYQRRCGQQET